MKQDAQYTLILESIAEMNARLRILDEAYARLEATAERQLELLEMLVARREQIAQRSPTGSGSRSDGGSRIVGAQASRIIDRNHEYVRDTHPALFKVIDLLGRDERARELSVRQLAHKTGVSKSWCAIAKRHVLRGESVH